MDLKTQKRMAASIFKVGEGKVWLDPDALDTIATAVTRDDIKGLINSGFIQVKRVDGASSYWSKRRKIQRLKGRRRGQGTRSGSKGARFPKKERWISTIRPLRRVLKELRDSEKIDRAAYRRLYARAKGGMFKSKAHLKAYLKETGLLEGD